MYGMGDILRIDLSSEKITREPITPDMYRRYIGGEGLNTLLFWEHFTKVDPRIEPTSPDNVLIWGLGPLAATAYGGGSKSRWTFKGPAYKFFADSTSGGAFGCQMRWAGYDHLVITGRAKHPVYVWVNDDHIEIRDAGKVWGKKVEESNNSIRKELGNRDLEMACIGPAGENLVSYSSITVSGDRAAGRTGGGCVFGSKNLKGVAALGTKGISVYDRKAFLKATDALFATLYPQGSPTAFGGAYNIQRDAFKKYGTLSIISAINDMGCNFYRNAQRGQTPEIDKLNGQWYLENMHQRSLSCSPGCAAACQAWHHIKGTESPLAKKYAGEYGVRPEYAIATAFGICCDIPDLPAAAHMGNLCNQYSMDIVETGMCIAFMMELWQRKMITPEDVEAWMGEPLSLEWGNCASVEKMIEAVGSQNNEMGRLLGQGVYRAARRIEELKGTPVMQYANYGKGGSPHVGSMWARPMLSFAAAVSPVGAHHLKGGGMDEKSSIRYLGRPEGGDPWSYTMKGAAQVVCQSFASLYNSLGLCKFAGATLRNLSEYSPELYVPALYALTGIELTPEELYAAGERIVNLQKAFNSRLGLRRKDDTLGPRWLNEPVTDGPWKGNRVADYLEQAKDEFYEAHGWDKSTSLQKREKLEQLGLKDVADLLEKEGALAS